MLKTSRFRLIFVLAAGMLLISGAAVRLSAQGNTGTILGTVTDTSGGAVPDAMVHVMNTGTSATVNTTSDAQGRYRVPALVPGNYQVSTEKAGFQSLVHTGIALDPGANVVVDFALAVGQVTQSVTVESSVSQVETTSSAISTVVEQTQMRDLPLNGRNFEELILLAPGATVNQGAGAIKDSFSGNSTYWSVSGSRTSGQGEILDGSDIQNYQDRGSGSGVLGTTIGVDAISEFQLLSNTYSARYGGNGGVVNAVTRSGTNDLHGSVYEFLRNSALDARNFADTVRQPLTKNQFGGTLGGPIKKDKMFFFVNYEGVRQALGVSSLTTVPDYNAVQNGWAPVPTSGTTKNCTTTGMPAGLENCGPGSPNASTFTNLIQPYLVQYPAASPTAEFLSGGLPTGTAQVTQTANEPGSENYVMGRFDWTIRSQDSLFARYLIDDGKLIEPFNANIDLWPEHDFTRNQFMTIGEKHIFTSVVNSLNLNYGRTFLNLYGESLRPNPTGQPATLPAGSLDFEGDLFTHLGEPIQDNALAAGSGIASLGNNVINPTRVAQNKFGFADDIFWTKGAHSFSFGGAAFRQQTNDVHAVIGGTWTFPSLQNFLTNVPTGFTGPCNYNNGGMPACVVPVSGVPLPPLSPIHDMRETHTSMYFQDDWKVLPTLTLNLGLRYAPTSNPWDTLNDVYLLVPLQWGDTGDFPNPVGSLAPSTPTPEKNFMLRNPSWHNIDPRIGVAWDPFKDHKTSVRAGYGIFHIVTEPRDYSYGAYFGLPWTLETQTTNLTFPFPFQAGAENAPALLWGTDPFNTTPYMQQWNLSVQREVMKNTVVTVAYVGSHGTHLLAQADTNPPVPIGGLTADQTGGITLTNGQTLYAVPGFATELNTLTTAPSLSTTTGVVSAAPTPASALTINTSGGNVVSITCKIALCALAAPNGTPVVDPATGQWALSHVVESATGSYSIQSNTHINPWYSYQNAGQTNSYSIYNALQASLVRRMSNNFSLQVSYTYSDCVDISSGDWGHEGGTSVPNPYNNESNRGNCVFMLRHNLSTNGLFMLPFKGNRLVTGWQLGGIFYFSTGGPFNVGTFANGLPDIGDNSVAGNRPNYVANAAGCNGQPINSNPVTSAGVFYVNSNCFQEPTVGEVGNEGRDSLFGPDIVTLNTSLQKNTKLTERFNLQFRFEVFNIFNRKNFIAPTFPSFSQGGSGSLASVTSAVIPGNFGQITNTVGYPLNASARQMQFGLKLLF